MMPMEGIESIEIEVLLRFLVDSGIALSLKVEEDSRRTGVNLVGYLYDTTYDEGDLLVTRNFSGGLNIF